MALFGVRSCMRPIIRLLEQSGKYQRCVSASQVTTLEDSIITGLS